MNVSMSYQAQKNYSGRVAERYDKRRGKKKKWQREMAVVEEILSQLPHDCFVADVPFGTGRFSGLYNRVKFPSVGIDISHDMLLQANRVCSEMSLVFPVRGDIRQLPLRDRSVDCVVCIRMLNWLPPGVVVPVLNELFRVARKGIIVGFRIRRPGNLKERVPILLRNMAPTPGHVRGWSIWFYHKARTLLAWGKGYVARTIFRKTGSGQSAVWHGKTFFIKEEMIGLFDRIGWQVHREYPVDTVAIFSEKKVFPYSIYWLVPKGSAST